MGGDFNNLETMEDQQDKWLGFLGIAQAKQFAWETLVFAVAGQDSWTDLALCPWLGSPDYSWVFRHEGGRLLERLDRLYVSDLTIGRGGQVGVVPRVTLLDTVLVISTLVDLAIQSLATQSCRIPNFIFTREEVRICITSLWDREWDACGDMIQQVA